MLSVSVAVPLLTMVLIPASAVVLLMGPMRNKPLRAVLRLYAGYVGVALLLGILAAAMRPETSLHSALAIAVLALGPVSGLFLGLRTEGVRLDPRLGFILGPLGYLAGCGVAIRAIMALGFGAG